MPRIKPSSPAAWTQTVLGFCLMAHVCGCEPSPAPGTTPGTTPDVGADQEKPAPSQGAAQPSKGSNAADGNPASADGLPQAGGATPGGSPPADRPGDSSSAPDDAAAVAWVACGKNRPDMCTLQYEPVCAELDTGVRCVRAPCPSSEQKTFSNACAACREPKVVRHRKGPCTAKKPATDGE